MAGDSPSFGQHDLLGFFGLSAATKAEAHAQISRALADPHQARRWLIERARRCVAAMQPAVAGNGGHNATFAVASTLVHGFGLSISEAAPIIGEYNLRCDPPWSERELDYKLRSAERSAQDKPRGHLVGDHTPLNSYRPAAGQAEDTPPPAVPAKVAFDPERLRTLSAKWAPVMSLVWLANRSTHDPSQISAGQFLELLYGARERVVCFTNHRSQGQALWPEEPPPKGGDEGVWFLPQPVSGEMLPNPRTGKTSRRSEESVTAFRYMVLESDQADLRDWLGLLVQVPLRIEAIYTSGGRSVHALVRVDAPTKRAWDAYKDSIAPTLNLLCLGGLDPKVITAVRLTRLPGCLRGNRLQKLLYVHPGAPVRKLVDMPVRRDVEGFWCELAGRGLSDADEDGGAFVARGLNYYAPASVRCREAAAQWREAQVAIGFDEGN